MKGINGLTSIPDTGKSMFFPLLAEFFPYGSLIAAALAVIFNGAIHHVLAPNLADNRQGVNFFEETLKFVRLSPARRRKPI